MFSKVALAIVLHRAWHEY